MDYSQVLYLRIGQLIDFMDRSFVLLLEIFMNIGKRLTNKVAIVTGGAQGFGLAISKKFIESGANVIIWDIDKQAIENALKLINSKNGLSLSLKL